MNKTTGKADEKQAPAASRRAIGDEGEAIACRYLEANGFTVLRRNFKAMHGEIDIIAAKGEYLIFAEVKTRTLSPASPLYGRPAAAVTKEKQRHIIAAAEEFLRKEPSLAEKARFMRFDVLEVLRGDGRLLSGASVTHFEGAFHK